MPTLLNSFRAERRVYVVRMSLSLYIIPGWMVFRSFRILSLKIRSLEWEMVTLSM